MNKKQMLLLGIILTIAFSAISGCSNKKETTEGEKSGHVADTVKIGYVDVTGKAQISDTLGIADDKGFLKEELDKIGVKAELIPFTGAGPAINEALAGKNLDIGFLGDVPAIIGKASGIDTQLIVASGFTNSAALLVPTESNATSIKDLKGKKIATQKGSFMHRILVKMLEDNGLTVDDIEFVNMTAQDAASALIAKAVDGIVVGGVTQAKLVLDNNAKSILDCSKNPEWIGGSAGVARTEYVKENPEIISALIKALDRAKELSISDATVSKTQWVKAGNSEKTYEFLYPNNDYRYDVEITPDFINKFSDIEQFLVDNKLIKNSVDIEKWTKNN